MATTTFMIRVDDGPPQEFRVKTGIYQDAAAAVPAVLGVPLPTDVEIWATHEGRELSRFRFRCTLDDYGRFVVQHLVRRS